MSPAEHREVEKLQRAWDDRAKGYDEWYKTFQGAVDHHVDWELLKRYLPKNKKATILDAAGGTGRITLPLAKMSYSLTLFDISAAMLAVAKGKMLRERVSNRVNIARGDVRQLPFADEAFDFVLCWDGNMKAAGELIRVTKKGGRISIFLVNKWSTAVGNFYEQPDSVLTSLKSPHSAFEDEDGEYRTVSPQEAVDAFVAQGIKVLDIYAVCGWLDVLGVPQRVRQSRHWDQRLFRQTTEMVLRLSQEPSMKGMSRHLVLYGEKAL